MKTVHWIAAAGMFLTLSCIRKTPQPVEMPAPKVSLVFTGDVMLDRGIRIRINQIGIDSLFTDVSEIFKKSDFTVINLECPATDTIHPQVKPYVFRAEPEWLAAVLNAGVTHANLANNHSIDQNENGLVSTIENLNRCGIACFGAGTDSSACSPVFIEKSGMTFALFGSAPIFLDYKKIRWGKVHPCILSAEELAPLIRIVKFKYPGIKAIVGLHWGREYTKNPSPRQQKDAHLLIDAGADAVIGHHPHVLQTIEMYRNKPIFYSLGNLIFDQRDSLTRKGMMVRMVFQADTLQTIELHPIVSVMGVPQRATKTNPNRPEIAVPDSAKKMMIEYKPERIST